MAQRVTVARLSAGGRAAVEEAASRFVPLLDEVAANMADQIHETIPGMPEALREGTTYSSRANIGNVVAMLRDDLDAATAVAPPQAIHYAREFVRAGLRIDLLMQAYRLGHKCFWSAWLEMLHETVDDADLLHEIVSYTSDWTFMYVDAVSVDIADVYMNERERWVRSAAAVRTAEVRAILDGTQEDEAQAGRRLRYELARTHVAMVVWADSDEGDHALGTLERLAGEIAQSLGGTDALSIPLGGTALAAWTGLRGEVDLSVLSSRSQDLAFAGARVAIGRPAAGIAGFRRSHDEALRARRVASLSRRSPGAVVCFSDIALNALLTTDVDEARRFVEAELGGLAKDDDGARRLAATLRVFLEEGSSFVRAARRLGIHENTVAYRVRRAGEVLGHGVETRQLELRVALQLADLLRRSAA